MGQPSPVGKAREPPGRHNDVIEQRDTEDLAGIGQATGHLVILAARHRIAARVVVDDQDRRG
jgi:hypothetical protein